MDSPPSGKWKIKRSNERMQQPGDIETKEEMKEELNGPMAAE
jgi:hypothetical protein